MPLNVGVLKDSQPFERRVSIVPDSIQKLRSLGLLVQVEHSAGSESFFSDEDYVSKGASISESREVLLKTSDIVTSVQSPGADDIRIMKRGAVLVGVLQAFRNPEIALSIEQAGVIGFALEMIPRITRAQSMDILSSQASAAGYAAAVLGAINTPRMFPMLTTAAGTIKPARVLVIGAGVAGLMSIATARRLGGSVTAYDVRISAGEDVRSLGARFLEPSIDASAKGGYARELTNEEKIAQAKLLELALTESDVIITTASVPGKKAPVTIGKESVAGMQPGTVIVDLAADTGGNCELTKAGETVVHNGVTIVGELNLPSHVPVNSSQMFSRNLTSFLQLLIPDGKLVKSFEDEILAACHVQTKNSSGAVK